MPCCFSCNTENGAKQGRIEDQVVSKKASVKFKPTGCILKYSLESSYNSGAFRLHSLSAKALVQSCPNPLASLDYKSKVIVQLAVQVTDESHI